MLQTKKLYIGGQWVGSHSPHFIDIENPATLEHFAQVPAGNAEDIDRAVNAAQKALASWSATPLAQRVSLMQRMFDIFKTKEAEIVETIIAELGAPRTFATATHCRNQFNRIASYIELAQTIQTKEDFGKSTVYREPIGVVACITPWNYPLGQIVQKVVPAILMGNTVVLKPSQHTPLAAYILVQAFDAAGFPAGVINLVTGRGSEVGESLAHHPLVDMVSFTGSTNVGSILAQTAMKSIKRVALELGGKSPYIWLPSDNYEKAVTKLAGSIFMNSGQTCTALSRLLVPARDINKVKELLLKTVKNYQTGDPQLESTALGPVSSRAQFDKVCQYIKRGLEEGATMLCGDVPPSCENGYFINPVIFTDVTNDMTVAREEIFGPVLCVLTYETVEEAIAIANDTPYGLNAAVFGPKDDALRVASQLKAGNVYINDAPRDVGAPFGGYKQSGIGREGGIEGLKEFTQLKAVYDRSTY